MHQHNVGLAADARDRRDIVNEIKTERVIKRCVDRMRAGDQEKRIAVRRCTYDRFGSDIAAGTWPVLDDERLTELLR